MKEVQIALLLPVTPDEYWQLFLADSEFKSRFHARRGDSAVRVGSWTPAPSPDGATAKQRISTLEAPISSHGLVRTIVGSMSTAVRDVELLRMHSNGTLQLLNSVHIAGSIGEQLWCECNWILQPCPQGSSLRVFARLEYRGSLFQGVLESHVAELTHAALSLWLGLCNERIADLRAPNARQSTSTPAPGTPLMPALSRRSTNISSVPRIPSTPVPDNAHPHPRHASGTGNSTTTTTTAGGGDLFDVQFDSDADLNDSGGGRRLSYGPPPKSATTANAVLQTQSGNSNPLLLMSPTQPQARGKLSHSAADSLVSSLQHPPANGTSSHLAPAPAASSATPSITLSNTLSSLTGPAAAAAAAIPAVNSTPMAHTTAHQLSSVFASPHPSLHRSTNATSQHPPALAESRVLRNSTAPPPASSTSSASSILSSLPPFPAMAEDADDADDSSSVSTDTDDSAEFFDVMKSTSSPITPSSAAPTAAAVSSSPSSAQQLEGELNLVRSQMAACLSRIHTLEHELSQLHYQHQQHQQHQQQQEGQPHLSTEHELLTQQRLDELTAVYKRLEQNRRERDRITHNRLLELENRMLASRFRRHPVALSVVAVVLVFVWPLVAIRLWDRVRGGGGVAQWLGGVASWMGWVFSWASSRFTKKK